MTGGLLPEDADTVIRMEDTKEESCYVVCTNDPGRGDGIRFRGEYLKEKEIVLCSGDIIGPVEIGVLATLRRAYMYVHQKPLFDCHYEPLYVRSPLNIFWAVINPSKSTATACSPTNM